MSGRVAVIDYGSGNIHSVMKALRHEGADVVLTADAGVIRRADRVVLPGVGAFADCQRGLEERGLFDVAREAALSGRPFLGICVGMQLLMEESEEFGRHPGLGLIPGRVVAIPASPGLKVPQIGWNRIYPPEASNWQGTCLQGLEPGTMVYFVHSYTPVPRLAEHRLADARYGGHLISAAVQRDNILGCQFHPEKSGPAGLHILRRFLGA